MKNKGDEITLDDVLDYYQLLSEEADTDALTKMIERYPQYESELREFDMFRKFSARLPECEYTEEEEQLLNARAVSVVQNLLYQNRQENASAKSVEAFSGLRDEIESQYSNPNEFYQKVGLSEGIIWALDACQVIFQTIPRKAIENIANALGKLFSTVTTYLRGEMQMASSHCKAEQAPEAAGKCTFSELMEMDDDLTEEQKTYWRMQTAIESDGATWKEGGIE
jgi:hypothetical protein